MLEIEYQKEIFELKGELAKIKGLVRVLLLENAGLKDEIKVLKNQLSLNSRNSSKPPSSDGFKKVSKSLREKSNKKPGGQSGHDGNTLKMVEIPDEIKIHNIESCISCGMELTGIPEIKKRQVFDLPEIKIKVTEHQVEVRVCKCGCVNEKKFPIGVDKPVQYGSGIKSFIAYLNNYQLIPYDRAAELIEDIFGHKISKGTLYNTNEELYEKLEINEIERKDLITASKVVNFDETGSYVSKIRKWLHVACTVYLTYYQVHKNRGKEAIDEIGILPNYKGTAVHDHYQSYNSYKCEHGFCNVHHLRELKFVSEQESAIWAGQMKGLLSEIKQAVDLAKDNSKENLEPIELFDFENRYQNILEEGLKFYPIINEPSNKRGRKAQPKGKNLLDRLIDFREATLAFMYNFEIPFDNNQAERDIRMMKVKQKISGCFRSQDGANFFARIRGYISTSKKNGLNILEAIKMAFDDKPFSPAHDY